MTRKLVSIVPCMTMNVTQCDTRVRLDLQKATAGWSSPHGHSSVIAPSQSSYVEQVLSNSMMPESLAVLLVFWLAPS